MNIIERFLELFRKKEYYVMDYEDFLEDDSFEFDRIDEEGILKIKELILNIPIFSNSSFADKMLSKKRKSRLLSLSDCNNKDTTT